MKNVVFLVKNGIGFGHIRRALLVAEELSSRHSAIRPIVVSQAHSLDLYRASRVRVVNFPLLHRVPSARTEDAYLEMLDALMARLKPAAVVEDTYPDARYGAVPSLRYVPRILIVRRLDDLSFDQMRETRAFQRYTRILLAQDRADFLNEGHSGDTRTAVDLSDRTEFIGNIHHVPTADKIGQTRARFAPDGGPLVVVTAGAGGDQLHDGYGDRLFGHCAQVAADLEQEGHTAKFVLVTGPYYAGRPIRETSNVVVRRFEPELSALLAAADTAVIKPGNNTLSETLIGSANLVLVPDVSFMEGVDEHARRTVLQYGGAVVQPEMQFLEQAIRTALASPLRTQRAAASTSALRRAVEVIRDVASAPPPSPDPKQVAVLIQDAKGVRVLSTMPTTTWRRVTPAAASEPSSAVLLGAEPPTCDPQALIARDVRVAITGEDGPSPAVRRWLRLRPPTPSLVVLPTAVVAPIRDEIDETAYCIARQLRTRPRAAVRVNLCHWPQDEAAAYVSKLLDWLDDQPVELTDLDTLAAETADQLMGLTS